MQLVYEKALRLIGKNGKYQIFVVLMLSLPACFLNAYNGFGLVFLGYTPEHTCSLPKYSNSSYTIEATKCELNYYEENSINQSRVLISEEPCDAWDYDHTYFTETFITKWDLVCEKDLQPKLAISVFCAVSVIGCIFYSYISDRFGRKVAFVLNLTTYLVGSVVSLFMPTMMSFTIVRCLAAVNQLSSWNISYTWALEYVGDKHRTITTTVMASLYACAAASLSLLAFLFRDWITLGLVMSLPMIALYSFIYLISESPRWLLSRGKEDGFLKVVARMLWWQGKSEKDIRVLVTMSMESLASGGKPKQDHHHIPEQGNFLLLFTNRHLRWKTIIITCCFLANSLFYVTIAYSTENLGELSWAMPRPRS